MLGLHQIAKRRPALFILLVLAFLALAHDAVAQSTEKSWDETVALAKKEGKVVVVGAPDPVMRNEVIPAFTKRYGIAVEYVAGRSGTSSNASRSSGLPVFIQSTPICRGRTPCSTSFTRKR